MTLELLLTKITKIENMVKYTQDTFDDFKSSTNERLDRIEAHLHLKSLSSTDKKDKDKDKKIKIFSNFLIFIIST